MYQINKIQNKITKLKECTFSELKFKEREHLQEWLAERCIEKDLQSIWKFLE